MLGIRRGNPNADFTPARAKADASTHANQASEILVDIGFAFDGETSVAAKTSLDATNHGDRRQTFKFQMGRDPLFQCYNHDLFLLHRMEGTRVNARAKKGSKLRLVLKNTGIIAYILQFEKHNFWWEYPAEEYPVGSLGGGVCLPTTP